MESAALSQARSFVFTDAPSASPARERESEAALELTASDGTGLVLVSLSARVVLQDPLAFTELTLTFLNPEARQLEGRFRIGLPSGATVSRFAMRIGSLWQEGEVVERQAARRAYEDFLHRRQDPALLEHEAGNEFSARVFPIEANSRKEIIVSYSHELTRPDDVYRLPLVGLPAIQSLDIRALVGQDASRAPAASSLGGSQASWHVVEVNKTNWKPDLDFEVRPVPTGRAGLRHENLAVVRVFPELPAEPDEISSLVILVDSSASRALGYSRQLDIVEELVRGLGRGQNPSCPVVIACFDQAVDVLFEGAARDLSADDVKRIRERAPLGASDLAGALAWVASRIGPRYERTLIVTDGTATAGDTGSDAINAAAKSLSGAGVQRIDALAVGGLRDDACLRRIVTAGLSRDGTVCDGALSPPEIAARLTRATRSGIQVEVPGASWVWPSRLDGVQPGDAALIYADVPAHMPVRVLLDKKPAGGGDLALGGVERPLLQRAWIKARIDRLEDLRARPDADPDVRSGMMKQIIELSVKNRVLSPYTALLVLETEADYERFHIDRSALSDILTVGLSGVELIRRTSASLPVKAVEEAPPPPRAFAAPKKSKARPELRPPPEAEASDSDESDDNPMLLRASRSRGGPPDERSEPAAAEAEEMTLAARVMDDAPRGDVDVGALAESEAPLELSSADRLVLLAPSPAAYAPSPEPADFGPPPAAYAPAPAPMQAAFAPPPMPAPFAPPPSPGPLSPEPPRAPASPLRRLVNAVTDFVSGIGEGSSTPEAPPPRPPPPPGAPPAYSPGNTPPVPQGPPEPSPLDSWSGDFRAVMALVLAGDAKEALELALAWRRRSPGDVLALIGIGEAAELLGDVNLAARAYGSIIDLFPSRADLRRFAGERLSRLASAGALSLAIDTYRKAVESRPDHPSGHRLLGMALLRAGRHAEAFEAISVGQARSYPAKFPGVPRILNEDLGLAAAAWIASEPSRESEIKDRITRASASLEGGPSVRFVLVWETDANDVDFHIHDAKGGHAYFREKALPSGGELYADVTQGYGPECFTIRGEPAARAYPYRLKAHYYRQGPMGYGMGSLQIVEHDGRGGFAFQERPYIVMRDGAYVDLGVVEGPLRVER